MNKKRIAIETTLISLLLIVIFVVFASVIYTSTKATSESQLSSALKTAERIFDGSDAETTGALLEDYYSDNQSDDDIRISVIQKTTTTEEGYTILFDTKKMYDVENKATELDNLNNFTTRTSAYGYNMIYLTTKDKQVASYYIRVAIRESSATATSRNFLLIGIPIFAFVVLLYVIFKLLDYKRTIQPLQEEIQKLRILSGDESSSLNNQDDLNTLSSAVIKIGEKMNQEIKDLKNEKKKTQTILDSISQGFMAISSNKKIILFNKAMKDIFNYDENEALNKDFYILMASQEFNDKVNKTLVEQEELPPFDMPLNGRIYQVSIMPITSPWNREIKGGVAVLVLDVSEERNVQKIKIDFFSNASHELKSPLTSILGYQEMIHNGIITEQEEIDDAVNKTIDEAKHMREILSDMLVINRLENGNKKNITALNVSDEIAHILSDLTPQALSKDINIHFYPQDILINADKEDIHRLFSNLLDNAIKYNKTGGEIEITMRGNEKIVIIKDTGIGIKEQDVSRIFERFYRVDNSRLENNIEGSGLGLSIVKHICESYGYKISVKSVFSSGTTFVVTLK